jgi:hypothetical protein
MATQSPPWYPYQSIPRRQAAPPRLGRARFLLVLLVVIAIGAILVTALAAVLTPAAPATCTQHCGPTAGVPVPQPAKYHSSAYGFDVAYSDPWKVVQQDTKSVVFQTAAGQFLVYGQNAGKSDQQLVQEGVAALPDTQFQSITPVTSIRGAHVGYQSGTGVIYSSTFLPEGGRAIRARLAVIGATKGGVSVTIVGIDPWVAAAPNGIPESSQFDAELSQFQWPA